MITQSELKAMYHYDEDTGHFTLQVSRAGRPSKIAPNSNGYHVMMIHRKRYYAHRLVWLYLYGEWPSGDLVVDHIDGDRMNNRKDNLRLLTRYDNMMLGQC